MTYKNILVDKKDKIGRITINRAEVRNALNPETVQELRQALEELRANDGIMVLIITGSGEKSFVSGSDISSIKDRHFLEALTPHMQNLYTELEKFEKPIIAAINGFALGGGCELAMACDLRIASENAKLGLPELNLGIIPGAGGTQRLASLVGIGKAKELIYTGEIINATEAERIGLVNKVVQIEELLDAAEELAKKIINKGPLALKLAKLSINSTQNLTSGLLIEALSQSILFASEDKYEGASAFLEKRKPNFIGR
ncbi:enoyl-CoA hydratase/isomerase family protein [Bacillus sp. JJ1562]|uniref:enoyl-CoA hydratase/isomerase family protein n=1 Tax=Bacillus sp. JJ1562 TaxID=3122960 RepID=UPI00300136F3